MPFLRQSTSQAIRFGPCLDITDGVTEETGLTLAQADMRLSKDGGAFAQKSAAGNATHDSDGWYSTTLSTTDTATVGELILNVHQPANMLPVWLRWWVLEEAVYDGVFGASAAGPLQPTTAGRTLDVTAGGAAGIDWGNIENKTTANDLSATDIQLADTTTTLTNKTGFSLAATGLDAIVSTATGMVEIAKAVWDRVLSGATHNIANSAGRRLRQIQEAGSYSGGFIYLDTVNGTAGTTDFENGVDSNPVDNMADLNTLSASLGINQFKIAAGSTVTLAAAQQNQVFQGEEWTLALGGQDIAGSYFEGATVSGTGVGTDPHFMRCEIGTVTFAANRLGFCRFTGTITLSAASDYYWHDCYSGVAGASTPVVDFGAAVANTNLSMRRYSGGVQINNKDGTGTDQMSLEGDGQLIVAASSGGAISVRGNFKVTNTGGATITYDDNTQNLIDALADTNELQGDWTDDGRLDLILDARASQTSVDAILFTKNAALSNIPFLMVDETDGITPETGLTVTMQRSIDGGAFANATGAVAEIANGWYQLDASQADMNGDLIAFKATATGAAQSNFVIRTGG